MSPSRRDILKLAAGLGLATTVPTSAERVAAMQSLDTVVSTHPLLDPGTFANDVDCRIGPAHDDWWVGINPERHATFRQAENRFEEMLPWMRQNELVWRAYNEYSSEMFNFVMESYAAGLKHGAAYENLRRSVVGEATGCRTCWSVGLTKTGETCPTCGGTGTVAMRS